MSAGANVKAVQRMLGHKSAAMTLDVYAELFDDDLDAVAERLDAATREILVCPWCGPEATIIPTTQSESGQLTCRLCEWAPWDSNPQPAD